MAQSPCFLMKPVKSVVGGQDGLISERFGISPPPPKMKRLHYPYKGGRNDRKTAQ